MSPGLNTRACAARRRRSYVEDERMVTEDRDSIPPNLVEDVVPDDDDGANIAVGVPSDEFQEPIPMEGIPELLKQYMCAVSPVLQGRHGVYDEQFFGTIVGLCSRGILVDQVLQKTGVTDIEIQEKWKQQAGDKYRFPMALSTDSTQAAQFLEHYQQVYGGQPCNDSFSLRFLRACFATFIHKVEINWVKEAVKRRKVRMEQKGLNRHKLGPVAMRQQLAALCAAVAVHYRPPESTTTSQLPMSTPVSNRYPGSRRHASSKRHSHSRISSSVIARAESELRGYLKLAQEARTSRDLIFKTMEELGEALVALERDERALNAQYTALVDEATVMQRQGAHESAMLKLKEGQHLVDKLISTKDMHAKSLHSIRAIRASALPEALKAVAHSKTCVAKAVSNFEKLKGSSFAMRPRAPFVYPATHSEPPLSITGPKFCAGCKKKGFVARAVIIASCGCGFHPICIALLLEENKHMCPCCETAFSGAWLAQLGVPLTSQMEQDVANMKRRLEAEAPLKTGELIPLTSPFEHASFFS